MSIIVDGYNLIYAIDSVRTYASPKHSDAERTEFIKLLASFARLSGHSMTVVFDGGPGNQKPGALENVRIIFSEEKSADSVIKEMVESSSYARDLTVVSSDREIRSFVRSFGATSISTKDFVKEMMHLFKTKSKNQREPREAILDEHQTDADYWLNFFRMDKEEVKRQNKKLKDLW